MPLRAVLTNSRSRRWIGSRFGWAEDPSREHEQEGTEMHMNMRMRSTPESGTGSLDHDAKPVLPHHGDAIPVGDEK